MLKADGYQPMLVNMRFIKPIDLEMLWNAAKKCEWIVTVEDNVRVGGMGANILEYYAARGIQRNILQLGFPEKYIEQGTQAQLFERYKLDAAGIYQRIKERMEEETWQKK